MTDAMPQLPLAHMLSAAAQKAAIAKLSRRLERSEHGPDRSEG